MKPMLCSLLLLVFLGCQFCTSTPVQAFPPEYQTFSGSLYASCRMRPNTQLTPGSPKVYGQVLFKQSGPEGKLSIRFKLHGLPASDPQPRAIHIHQYGDLSQGCTSTGGHYNPLGYNHPNHPGDFGNFTPRNGKIRRSVDSRATLFGGLSVLGRAVVIHEKEDDLGRGGDAGSLLHGNAGGRLACCVIGLSSSDQWNK
ncbi:extracellular superoxide dismutase [Cu-Zn] [Astyanax mexicanus]|uniref:Superoxide dismutase [Cu-Zn] n=1 Tax=Astyanax mexicanus TaxID=7994 RepID=A0A8T2M413_ASTMX|nr:extracellular superoxide dismutase [Cu-Zn] [Astyanax mexicanus]KAG9275731.1 extracellular superoxide dismutase Cu-Zn-like [Astyanax mexicanus]